MPSEKKEKKREFIRFLGVASTVGINMVVSTFVGFALGYWVVDEYLDTHPWFTVILTLLGIVAGFRYLFRIARKADERNKD
ncbi:MAG: AtpZ/AtpI family protein [Deferribacteres bacterium]|nr:AtpZ/AtpI family protein [Deferribacteres bacterium]